MGWSSHTSLFVSENPYMLDGSGSSTDSFATVSNLEEVYYIQPGGKATVIQGSLDCQPKPCIMDKSLEFAVHFSQYGSFNMGPSLMDPSNRSQSLYTVYVMSYHVGGFNLIWKTWVKLDRFPKLGQIGVKTKKSLKFEVRKISTTNQDDMPLMLGNPDHSQPKHQNLHLSDCYHPKVVKRYVRPPNTPRKTNLILFPYKTNSFNRKMHRLQPFP